MPVFGRKPIGEMPPIEVFCEFLINDIDTEKRNGLARGATRPIALLDLQIPASEGAAAGWAGGKPYLPVGTDWPAIDGQPLGFACQIDLAALPADLWDGAGPRTGSLAVFVTVAGRFEARVLHVRGDLAERDGPGQAKAGWTRNVSWKDPYLAHSPRWPLVAREIAGAMMPPRRAPAPAVAEDGATTALGLDDPAFLPFDKATFHLLREALEAELLKQAQTACGWSMSEDVRPADRAWYQQQKPVAMASLQRFYELTEPLRSARFDPARVADVMAEVATLPAFEHSYDRTDADGCREARYRPATLNETLLFARTPTPFWWTEFQRALRWHAVVAYTREAAALPPPLQARLEATWREETAGRFAAMGHAPAGHIYTPHGPNTANEVLLGLPTSDLVGWIWGDCHSLVLLIDRGDLKRGDFGRVMLDITN